METTQTKPKEAFKITGDWALMSKKLKEKYPLLTDEDLVFEVGKETELLKRIESRLKKKHDEVVHLVKKSQRSDTL